MKNYTITVNGTVYEVCVEEGAGAAVAAAPVAAAAPKKAAPKKAAAPAGAQGDVKIVSPMPGKILKTNLSAGAAVKKGDVVLVLEAMKMENEIVAPQDGTLASVNVTVGQSVEAGEVLATMN
ncbi:MAG: biotin/lipoyl-binding protein [Clostridia bacterium]|nr:biotin/lipoyl-binding protein [Clostridia bacterium]